MSGATEQPYSGPEPYLFVSYARDDASTVLPVIRALRASGVRVWWDHAIQPGQRFGAEIERRLDGAAGVIVFLTARALRSDWILQETKHANEHDKSLFPVLLDGSALPLEWKSLIGRIQHIAGERRSPDFIAEEIRTRAMELGCGGATVAPEGEAKMQSSNHRGPGIPWVVAGVLAVAMAVLATLYFTGGGSSRFGSRGAAPSAPEVPSSYLAGLGDESREWTWSRKSAMTSNTVTLHWEQCKGVANMYASNADSVHGTLEEVRGATNGLPLRACRFCYEIEFNRKMRESRAGAASGGVK